MAVGAYDQMATYLTDGYWTQSGDIAHQWASTSVSVNIDGLQAADQTLAQEALQLFADVSGLSFTYTSGSADITYDDVNSGAVTNASWYSPSGNMISADVNISTTWDGGVGSGIESFRFQTFIHETGHALGLGHQGPYNTTASYPSDALYDNDSWNLSVMSYFDQVENTWTNASYANALTPQLVDILAIQGIYGAGSVRTGNDTYGVGNNTGRASYGVGFTDMPTVTIYDSGGTDTLDYSGYYGSQVIDLAAEGMSSVYGETNNIIIARGVTIENVVGGSGVDYIYGNNVANTLTGNAGNDIMYGYDGNDTFRYVNGQGAGAGEQIYGGNGYDRVLLSTVTTGDIFDFRGAYGSSIEELEFGANVTNVDVTVIADTDIFASNPTPHIDGNNNTGSTEAIKIYINALTSVDLSGWTFQDWGGQGETITIYGDGDNEAIIGSSQIDYIFGAGGTDNISGGLGADILNGGGGGDFIWGDSGSDYIYGEDGGDMLDGQGEADFLWGGAGVDWMYGGNDSDMLDGGSEGDYLYGQDGADWMYGGAGADTLDGGTGGDYLYGGAGGDMLIGRGGSDTLDAGEGADYIWGGTEGDMLIGRGGADTMDGEAGVDYFWGESGADTMYGGSEGDVMDGGSEGDLMYGQGGADTMYGGSGIDTMDGGADSDLMYGHGEGDTMYGGGGDDIMDGGTGNDTMYGGSGNDGFLFANGTGQDTIGDFTAGAGTGDYADVSAFGFASFAALLAASSNQAYGVLIQLDGDDSLILSGLTTSQLHANDFVL